MKISNCIGNDIHYKISDVHGFEISSDKENLWLKIFKEYTEMQKEIHELYIKARDKFYETKDLQ